MGLGNIEFAKSTGISLARIRLLENDSRLPNEEELRTLEQMLGFNLRVGNANPNT